MKSPWRSPRAAATWPARPGSSACTATRCGAGSIVTGSKLGYSSRRRLRPRAAAVEVAPMTDDVLFAGQVISGRFRLRRLLGQGGMGRVWLAEHLALGTDIAVKF